MIVHRTAKFTSSNTYGPRASFQRECGHGTIQRRRNIQPGYRRQNDEGHDVKREEILEKLAAGELTVDEANRLLAEAEQQKRGSLFCKVSQKSALSVYGLQRMPVTLYVGQWERLLDFADDIRQFAKEHDGELSRKKQT